MGIALFSVQRLFAPLHGLMGFFRRDGLACSAQRAPMAARPHERVVQARPLRVLRVLDRGHAPACAGRMRISGRMADVCAELDRLAATEAA